MTTPNPKARSINTYLILGTKRIEFRLKTDRNLGLKPYKRYLNGEKHNNIPVTQRPHVGVQKLNGSHNRSTQTKNLHKRKTYRIQLAITGIPDVLNLHILE